MTPEQAALYDGEVVMTSHLRTDGTREVTIDRADPRIRVSMELVGRLGIDASFDGSLLKLLGANGTVIYRVDGEDFPRHQFLMSWPD